MSAVLFFGVELSVGAWGRLRDLHRHAAQRLLARSSLAQTEMAM